MRRVLVYTSTRADYGILYWLIHDLSLDDEVDLKLLVSGSHLSHEFGFTSKEIENDGYDIGYQVPILSNSDSKLAMLSSLGQATIDYGKALEELSPDVIVLLGDRFEAFSCAQAAFVLNIPVLHLHGGELTDGAYDDVFRHCITKLSLVHCVACERYRQRVIQLGENPDRVFNVGSLGLEHIHRSQTLDIEILNQNFSFDFSKPYIVFTFHPETICSLTVDEQIDSVLEGLARSERFNIVMTYPNIDSGGRIVIRKIESFYKKHSKRVLLVKSLGHKFFHSVVYHSNGMVGNSSSGIIEAPSLGVPTINIGYRQKGRACAKSVIHIDYDANKISHAINSLYHDHIDCDSPIFDNPYDAGNTSSRVVELIKTMPLRFHKTFHDVEVTQ